MTRLFHLVAALLAACSLALAIHQARAPAPIAPEPQIASMFTAAGFTLTAKRQISLGPEFLFSRPDCPEPTRVMLTGSVHRDAMQALIGMATNHEELITVYGGAPVPSLRFSDIAWLWLKRKLAVTLGLSNPSTWDSIGLAAFIPRQCPGNRPDWSVLTPALSSGLSSN